MLTLKIKWHILPPRQSELKRIADKKHVLSLHRGIPSALRTAGRNTGKEATFASEYKCRAMRQERTVFVQSLPES